MAQQYNTYKQETAYNLKTTTKHAYLHPKDRILQSTQIGHSGHRNAYNTGVLDANWTEDRTRCDDAYSLHSRNQFVSTSHSVHDKKQPIPNNVSNSNTMIKQTHPRDSEINHFVSLNQMTFGAGMKTEDTYNLHGTSLKYVPVGMLSSGAQGTLSSKGFKNSEISMSSSLRHKTVPVNQQTELYNGKEEDQMTTTYRSMMKNIPQASSSTKAPRPTNKWGRATQGLDDSYRKMDLRGNFPLKLTPMNK